MEFLGMRKKVAFTFSSLIVLTALLSGCATWHKLNNTEKGGTIGAAAGAIVGAAVAGPVGVVVGGAAGAFGGIVIGDATKR
jgi:hypothetical protein